MVSTAALAALDKAYGDPKEHERRVWRTVAFLGRYAHQDATATLGRTMSELYSISSETAEFLKIERPVVGL